MSEINFRIIARMMLHFKCLLQSALGTIGLGTTVEKVYVDCGSAWLDVTKQLMVSKNDPAWSGLARKIGLLEEGHNFEHPSVNKILWIKPKSDSSCILLACFLQTT